MFSVTFLFLFLVSLSPEIRGVQKFDWEEHLDHGSLYNYPTYQEALHFLDTTQKMHSNYVSKQVIGMTVEGRKIFGYHVGVQAIDLVKIKPDIYDEQLSSCLYEKKDMQISELEKIPIMDYPSETSKQLPGFLIFSLQHAREPISLTNSLYFIRRLLTMASSLTLEKFERYKINLEHAMTLYLINTRHLLYLPVMNIDGYEYIRLTKDRMKRKNQRKTCPLERISGVDLNRNFGFHFRKSDGCDAEEYSGPFAFSEPESQALRCFVDSFDVRVSVNIHAYGDIWTHPFNCCNETRLPPRLREFYDQVKKAANLEVFDNSGRLQGINYNANGEADDWLLAHRGILSIGPEIGSNEYGFWPPQKAISGLNEENYWRYLSILVKTGSELVLSLMEANDFLIVNLKNFGASTFKAGAQLLFHSCPSTIYCKKIIDYVPKSYTEYGISHTQVPYTTWNYLDLIFATEEEAAAAAPVENSFYSLHQLEDLKPQQTLSFKLKNLALERFASQMVIISIVQEKSCYTMWIANISKGTVSIVSPMVPAYSTEACETQLNFAKQISQLQLMSPKLSSTQVNLSSITSGVPFKMFAVIPFIIMCIFAYAFCCSIIFIKNPHLMSKPCYRIMACGSIDLMKRVSFLMCCFPRCLLLHKRLVELSKEKSLDVTAQHVDIENDGATKPPNNLLIYKSMNVTETNSSPSLFSASADKTIKYQYMTIDK